MGSHCLNSWPEQHENPSIPRVSALGHRLQRLQRPTLAGIRQSRARSAPPEPGAGAREAGVRRRARRLGQRRDAEVADVTRARALHRLPAGHRRPAAGLRRRPLRRHRGPPVPGADGRRDRGVHRAQRRRRARGGRARAAGPRAGQPPRDGPGDPGPRARPAGDPVRREGPRQRARVRRQARPRALPALRPRGRRAGARRSSSARGTPRSRCGRRWTTTTLPGRTRLGPPGVDVEAFAPAEPAEARRKLRGLAERLEQAEPEVSAEGSSFARDVNAAGRELARLDPERERLVVFVGKLIVSKGVDLLAAAWPLVQRRVPDATLVVVGFGAYAEGFGRLLRALEEDDDDDAARAGERGARDRGRAEGAAAAPDGSPRAAAPRDRRAAEKGRLRDARAGDRAPRARRARTTSFPRATRRSSRARSPRRSGWSPPRARPAGCCR